ncbi:TolC family protein [Croceicoccus sp. YJ47]|nr:TolC family protein [Croceicoccus sp. YJ47]
MLMAGVAHSAAQDSYGPPVPADIRAANTAIPLPPAVPDRLGMAAARTVSTYPAMDAAQARIRASEADVDAAEWMRFPSVSVGGRIGDNARSDFAPQIQIEQPIWTGGRITGNIERAEAVSSVADAQLAETAQQLAMQTINAYYEAVRATRREKILNVSLAEHQRLVESMTRRVEQEVSPRSDLDLAKSRTAQVRQQLSQTIAQRYTSLQRLAQLTGNADFELGPVPEYSRALHHPPTDSAVLQALTCDPTRRRFAAEAQVAEADRKLAKAQIMPNVGVQLSDDEIYGTRFGVVVTAQSSGGLAPFAAARGAALREQASLLQITVAERELRESILLDVVENATSAETIESSDAAAIATDNVTESFVRQFITGKRTWLDVMNAVRESMAAQITLVDAQTTAMASAARLLLRTCEWRPDLMETGDRMDAADLMEAEREE